MPEICKVVCAMDQAYMKGFKNIQYTRNKSLANGEECYDYRLTYNKKGCEYMIREFQMKDALSIYQLNKEEMGYDYPLEETILQLEKIVRSPKDKIYICEIDHRIVGYVHACDYQLIYQPPFKNIMGIAVLSTYKRQGIGTKLLEAIEDWARRDGAKGLRLSSGLLRENTHAFYHHYGFGLDHQQINMKKLF